MPQTSKRIKTPPASVEMALIQLGKNIRTARLRRRLRLEDVAQRLGISRYVMSDIEKGKPSTAIASYLGALWVLGLLKDMQTVADPDRDSEGKILEKSRTPKTAGKRKKALDNDF
jgi:transcriptional regulator with XRE-family HTH domain